MPNNNDMSIIVVVACRTSSSSVKYGVTTDQDNHLCQDPQYLWVRSRSGRVHSSNCHTQLTTLVALWCAQPQLMTSLPGAAHTHTHKHQHLQTEDAVMHTNLDLRSEDRGRTLKCSWTYVIVVGRLVFPAHFVLFFKCLLASLAVNIANSTSGKGLPDSLLLNT